MTRRVRHTPFSGADHGPSLARPNRERPFLLPQLPGVRTAARARAAGAGLGDGGDWYDVVPLPAGHVGLVIGDVQGHDATAAAVMRQVRATLRARAAEGVSPAELMGGVSSFLYELDTDRFATCLYADLDPATGHADVIRAGHHGPIIRHSDGVTSRPALRGGLPLGLFRDAAPYPTACVHLDLAETLCLCTDGLVEGHDRDIDLGMERIGTDLRHGPADLQGLADHLVASLEHGPPSKDDIAVLLAMRSEQVPPPVAPPQPPVEAPIEASAP